MKTVKNFLDGIWEVILAIQTARAAEDLARAGRYKEAQKMYIDSRRGR
jgi:hypothetical protein